jgi:hypothetical protein
MKPQQRLIFAGVILALGLALFFGVRSLNEKRADEEAEEVDPLAEELPEPLFPVLVASFDVVESFRVTDNSTGAVFAAETRLVEVGPPELPEGFPTPEATEEGPFYESQWFVLEAPEGSDTGLGVDNDLIAGSVASLPTITPTRTLTDVETLIGFGLESPAYRVEFTTTSGDVYSFTVGSLNPGGTAYYLQVGQNPAVHLVSSFNLDTLLNFPTEPPYIQPATETEGEG